MKVEKVIVAPVYKLELSLEELSDVRMAVYETSKDPGYMSTTQERMKALYDTIRENV